MTAAETPRPALRDVVIDEVRAWMGRRRMSGAELARQLGKSQSFVARRIDGRQTLDIDDLEAIARVLEVPVSAFFVAGDVPFPSRAPQPNSRRPRVVTGTETDRYSPGSSTHRRALRLVSDATGRYPDVHAGNGSMAPGHGQRTPDDSQESSRAVNDADAA